MDKRAIVARIERGRLLLDLRTIAPEEDRLVIASLLIQGTAKPQSER